MPDGTSQLGIGLSMRRCVGMIGLVLVLAAVPSRGAGQAPTDTDPQDGPVTASAPPSPLFTSDLLERVVDGENLLPTRWQNREEVLAYEKLILHARQIPNDVLAGAARRDLRLNLLFGPDKSQFRGTLIHLKGSLRLLEQMELSEGLKEMSPGLTKVYRGWIALDGYRDKDNVGNVLCIVDFTELPPGLNPGDKADVHVGVDAYFFKIAKYETREPSPGGVTDRSPDGRVMRLAPLFIARTVHPAVPAAVPGGSIWAVPEAVVLGTIVLAFLAAGTWFVVSWWLGRQDARVRARLKELRPGAFSPGSATNAVPNELVEPEIRGPDPFGHSPSVN